MGRTNVLSSAGPGVVHAHAAVVESSRAAPVAQPPAVTNLILDAHRAVSPSTDTVSH
jgi:hypothetical protein